MVDANWFAHHSIQLYMQYLAKDFLDWTMDVYFSTLNFNARLVRSEMWMWMDTEHVSNWIVRQAISPWLVEAHGYMDGFHSGRGDMVFFCSSFAVHTSVVIRGKWINKASRWCYFRTAMAHGEGGRNNQIKCMVGLWLLECARCSMCY